MTQTNVSNGDRPEGINKKYYTNETVPKSNREMVETETKWIPILHIHNIYT